MPEPYDGYIEPPSRPPPPPPSGQGFGALDALGVGSSLAPGFSREVSGGLTYQGKPPDAMLQGGTPAWEVSAGGDEAPKQAGSADAYVKRVMALEGSGKDPNSTAVGGFINDTWLHLIQARRPDLAAGKSPDQILALRNDPTLRSEMVKAYAQENIGPLVKAGYQANSANLRLAHWFGPEGALRVLNASPETRMSQIFSPEVIAVNNLDGKTAGDVLNQVSQQMNGTPLKDLALGDFNAQAQESLKRLQSDRERANKQWDAAILEAKDLRSAARAATAKWMEEGNKPPQNMHEAWQQWGVVASAIAALGGIFGRHQNAALTAAGTMLQAANSADQKAYDAAYTQWKNHQDQGLKLIELLNADARAIVEDARKPYDQITAELQNLSAAYGLHQHLNPKSVENLTKSIQLQREDAALIKEQHAQKGIDDYVAERTKEYKEQNNGAEPPATKRVEWEGEAKRVGSGTAYRPSQAREIAVVDEQKHVVKSGAAYQSADGKWYWVGPNNEPVDVPQGGTVHLKSTQQSRSAPQMYMQKVMEEHPEFTSKELAIAAAEFRRYGAIESAFAGGVNGRNLIALNTVADHILLIQEYAAALNNGQIPRANQIANAIAVELGKPEVTSFRAGRDIMADEIVRLLTSTGGTESDRKGMQSRLADWESPDQMEGVITAFKRFVGGRFEALEQNYAGNDVERRKHFEGEMLTPKARQVFASVTSGDAKASETGHLPEGVPAGAKKIGTHQGKDVYEAPNGKRYVVE